MTGATLGLTAMVIFYATWALTDSPVFALACQLVYVTCVALGYLVAWRVEFGEWWFRS